MQAFPIKSVQDLEHISNAVKWQYTDTNTSRNYGLVGYLISTVSPPAATGLGHAGLLSSYMAK